MGNPSEFGQRLGQAIGSAGQTIGESIRQKYLKEMDLAQQKAKEAELRAQHIDDLYTNYYIAKGADPATAQSFAKVGGEQGIKSIQEKPMQLQSPQERNLISQFEAFRGKLGQQEQLGQMKSLADIGETRAKTKKLEMEATGVNIKDTLSDDLAMKFSEEFKKYSEDISPEELKQMGAKNANMLFRKIAGRQGWESEIVRDDEGIPTHIQQTSDQGKIAVVSIPGTTKVRENLTASISMRQNIMELFKKAIPLSSGRIGVLQAGKSAAGLDADTREVKNLIGGFLSLVSRNVAGERGVLTDQDIERIKPMLPVIGIYGDTQEEMNRKLNNILSMIDNIRQSGIDYLEGAYSGKIKNPLKSEQKSYSTKGELRQAVIKGEISKEEGIKIYKERGWDK